MTPRHYILAGVVLAAVTLARAYVFIGSSWPSGTIVMRLQLDATGPSGGFPLTDGSTSWNAVAMSALGEWNTLGGRSRFSVIVSPSATAQAGDDVTNVTFSSTVYGQAFGARTAAVTLPRPLDNDRDQVRTVEADVVVNTAFTWNSYRGSPVATADLRRVLLHEFGHVLGLGHPDEAGQSVSSIMLSTSSSIERLQPDDIAGFNELYNTSFAKPVVTTQPASRTLDAGASTRLEIAVDGRSPPATDQFHSTRWFFRAAGATDYEVLFTLHKPGAMDFNLAQPLDSGDYFYRIVTPDDTVDSNVATLRINPLANAPTTALANLSTRGIAGSTGSPMIVGFVVAGSRAKTVLIRAVGPTLGSAPFNVPGILSDPRLTVTNSSGSDVAVSATGTWDSSPNVAAIRDATARVGAFALAASSRDAVVVATLPPGSYTVRTTSASFNSGVVLVEAYDADATADPASRLMNLSTRGFVGSGANLLIAGFVVRGPGPRTYLVRAAGDTLKSFGVTGTLDDPVLRLYRADGTLARELDDWDSPGSLQPALRAAFQQVGAFAFTDRQESAMLVTLQPGNYTAQISGFVGGSSTPTGVALVEIYEMP